MRKLIRILFLLVNLLLIACALITFWGSSLSPDRFVIPAYFALIFPWVVFANIAFVLFWSALRKWYFVLSLGLLVLAFPKISTTFPVNIHTDTPPMPDGHFTVMTYNTWMLGGLKKHSDKSPNMVVQHILDSDPDIVCLQEFSVATNFITEQDVHRIFKKYPYKHIYYKSKRTHRRSGIATFSKYPIIGKTTIGIPSEYNSAIRSDIVIGMDTIRLFNCHLESNRLTEKDKAMPAELRRKFDAEHLSSVTQHLSRKLGTAYKARARQADVLSEHISQSPYKAMVCGDFNDVPLSYTYVKVRGELCDAFEELGFGLGFTFNEDFYKFRIDYILHDRQLIPLRLKRDKVPYSDHYPVSCTFSVGH